MATEEVGIFEALGRVLARDVISPSACRRTTTRPWTATPLPAASWCPASPHAAQRGRTALAGKAWTGTVNAASA